MGQGKNKKRRAKPQQWTHRKAQAFSADAGALTRASLNGRTKRSNARTTYTQIMMATLNH